MLNDPPVLLALFIVLFISSAAFAIAVIDQIWHEYTSLENLFYTVMLGIVSLFIAYGIEHQIPGYAIGVFR